VSAGAITAGGCLGILIPPSVMLIVYGATAGVSVVKLYAGAFFPGLMLAGLYIVYVIVLAKIKPSLMPPLSEEERRVDLPPILQLLRDKFGTHALTSFLKGLKGASNIDVPMQALLKEFLILLIPGIFCLGFLGLLYLAASPSYEADDSAPTTLSADSTAQSGSTLAEPPASTSSTGLAEPPTSSSTGLSEPPSSTSTGLAEPPSTTSSTGLAEPPTSSSTGLSEPPSSNASAASSQEPERGTSSTGLSEASSDKISDQADKTADVVLPTWYKITAGIMLALVGLLYWRLTMVRLEVFKMLLASFFPLAFLILSVLGTIVFGLATPTEAAAVGSLGGFLLAFAYKQLNMTVVKESVFLTAKTSAMVCWLFVGSSIFSAAFALLGGQELIERWVL
jgi:TRAP-type mannitol/chloroaromatic compound transport system permease large subunit